MKQTFLIIFFAGISLHLHAQFDEPRIKKFGIRAGANYSLMNFNKAFITPIPAVKNVWKPGFTVGALLQLRLNNLFALQPEYAFTKMNGEDPRINTSYKINYLSMPLFLKIQVLENLAILAGPQFDLLIRAKAKNMDSVTTITHETEERGISGVVGLELRVYKSFFLDVRYLQVFNHISIQRSYINEFKWTSLTMTAGMRF